MRTHSSKVDGVASVQAGCGVVWCGVVVCVFVCVHACVKSV